MCKIKNIWLKILSFVKFNLSRDDILPEKNDADKRLTNLLNQG